MTIYPCPRPIRGELATGRAHTFEGALSECGRWFRFRHGGCTWYLRVDDLEAALCMSTEATDPSCPRCGSTTHFKDGDRTLCEDRMECDRRRAKT